MAGVGIIANEVLMEEIDIELFGKDLTWNLMQEKKLYMDIEKVPLKNIGEAWGKAITISFDTILVASELIPVLQSYFYEHSVLPEDDILFKELNSLLQILIARKDHHTQPLHICMHNTLQICRRLLPVKYTQSISHISSKAQLVIQLRKILKEKELLATA